MSLKDIFTTLLLWEILLFQRVATQDTSAILYTEQEIDSRSTLHRLELSSSCVTCLVNCDTSCPRDRPLTFDWSNVEIGPLDFLYKEEKIIFHNAATRKIESIKYSTAPPIRRAEHILCSDSVKGIAVDWIGDNLYYTDSLKAAIVITSLRTNTSKLLVHRNVSEPFGVAVDALRGYVCWTDLSKKMVECLRLRDMKRTVLNYAGPEEPTSITFDSSSGYVYWADSGRATIYKGKPDGSEVTTMVVNQGTRYYGMTFTQGILLVADRGAHTNHIHLYSNDSNEPSGQLDAKVNGVIMDMTFYDKQQQAATGSCSSSSCSGGMCVMTGPSSRTCFCQAGTVLQGDSCLPNDDLPSPCFIYAVGSSLCFSAVLQVEEYTSGSISRCSEITSSNIKALGVHDASKTLYFTMEGSSNIWRLDRQGALAVFVTSAGHITDLAVDQTSGALYWTLMDKNEIWIHSDMTKKWKDQTRPNAIIVLSEKKMVYWSTLSARPVIYRASLAGTAVRQIRSGGRAARHLAYDGGDRIYWAGDSGIYSMNLEGDALATILSRPGHTISGLSLWKGYLGWTESGSVGIQWVTKDGSRPTGHHLVRGGTSSGPVTLYMGTDQAIECQVLSQPMNGVWNCPSGRKPGAACSATCTAGYRVTGDKTIECQSNGLWTSFNTQCTRIVCPAPPYSFSNGGWRCPATKEYGSSCDAYCNLGYYLSATATLTCRSDGTWSGENPSCLPLSCSPMPMSGKREVDCTDGSKVGSVCKITCTTGYRKSYGDETRTCLYTRMWSGQSLVCEPMECPSLPGVNKGTTRCTDDYNVGSVCTTTCTTGFSRSGSTERQCTISRTWSGTTNSCNAKRCPAIDRLDNGAWSCQPGEVVDGVCTASCHGNFSLNGSRTRTCLAAHDHQYWSGTQPKCLPCTSLPDIPNGRWSCPSKTVGSECHALCDEGFRLVGTRTRTCVPGSTQSSWTGTTCVAQTCPNLTVTHGRVDCKDRFKILSQCNVTCDVGYDLTGSRTRICQSDQIWSGSDASCIPRDCGRHTQLVNGEVTCTMQHKVGSVCTMSCVQGYQLRGTREITCLPNQTWSGSGMSCEPLSCLAPKGVASGNWTCPDGFQVGSSCTLICPPGLLLQRHVTWRCHSNQTWTGPQATCPDKCSDISNSPNTTGSCQDLTVGSSCSFGCDTGFVPVSGDRVIECTPTLRWSGTPLQCTASACGSLDVPEYVSSFRCQINNNLMTCTMKCRQGYVVTKGNEIRTCAANGVWSGKMMQCTSQENVTSTGSPPDVMPGAAIGGAIGGAVLLILIVILAVVCSRKKKGDKDNVYAEPGDVPDEPPAPMPDPLCGRCIQAGGICENHRQPERPGVSGREPSRRHVTADTPSTQPASDYADLAERSRSNGPYERLGMVKLLPGRRQNGNDTG